MITTTVENYTLRHAAPDDVPVILSFIRQLAEYEKLAHEAVATEEDLTRTLFGDKPYAEVIIGEYEGAPVSFALFFHNYSTFLGKPGIYLEDLFVQPDMRSKGFGKVLLSYLAQVACDRGCGRFEWSVLDWNEPAIGFYRSIGAAPMDEWTVQRLDGEALHAFAQTFQSS